MMKTDGGIDKRTKGAIIINVAQKRFGLYGLRKTSMQDIADDLKLSKASLYYYFPDKESLYRAVIEKEQTEFISKISERIMSIQEPEQLLLEYVNARLTYFRTLLNLSRLRFEEYSELKPVFMETIRIFKKNENKIVRNIFEKGIRMGKFSIKDPDVTASLFLDILKGLRISVVNDKKMLVIEQKEFEQLRKNTISFTEIFINGLKFK